MHDSFLAYGSFDKFAAGEVLTGMDERVMSEYSVAVFWKMMQ